MTHGNVSFGKASKNGDNPRTIWTVNLSTLGLVIGIISGLVGLFTASYGAMRFLVHPVIVEEVDKGIATHRVWDSEQHVRIEHSVEANRAERVEQLKEYTEELRYIRSRIDQIADRVGAAPAR